MRRIIASMLVATAVLASRTLLAQAPATTTPPSTRAGAVLRAWLEAFDSGDSARLATYYHTYQPELTAESQLDFRERTGGFDLLSIVQSEPSRVEFLVKERSSPTTAYGILAVSAAEPPRVETFRLMGMGPNVTAADLRIDAAARKRAIEGAIAELDTFYVFPDVAKRIADSLHARLARGVYEQYTNGMSFAARLNDDVRALGHDKHLRFDYSARALPPLPAAPLPPTPEMIARRRQQLDEINCGFVKAEQLPGNIGYLKFNGFVDPELCGPTASAAMTFLAGTRALIIDLRENGGGSPAMVSYIASYLFSHRTHLNDLWNRHTGNTEEFWTDDSVPGRHFGGEKPVYVLTSSRTFSGAEEFTYDLKTQKRATVVGETTGGGAHPVSGHRIDEHFMIGVPEARAINPLTHTNWEGVGVEPDVKVPAADALATAEKLARSTTAPNRTATRGAVSGSSQ
jgi:hypothetical protein